MKEKDENEGRDAQPQHAERYQGQESRMCQERHPIKEKEENEGRDAQPQPGERHTISGLRDWDVLSKKRMKMKGGTLKPNSLKDTQYQGFKIWVKRGGGGFENDMDQDKVMFEAGVEDCHHIGVVAEVW